MEDLDKMSLVELRVYGKGIGMKNVTTFKKKELLEEIKKIVAGQNASETQKRKKAVKKEETAGTVGTEEGRDAESEKGSSAREEKRGKESERNEPVREEKRTVRRTAPEAGKTARRPAGSEERRTGRKGNTRKQGEADFSGRMNRQTNGKRTYNQERYGGVPERHSSSERFGNQPERHSSSDRFGGQAERHSPTDRYGGQAERHSPTDRYGNQSERHSPADRYSGQQDERQTMHTEDRRANGVDEHRIENGSAAHKENFRGDAATMAPTELYQLDSGETKSGILEVMPEGYGFVRCDNFLPGEADVYVSPAMIRKFGLRTGDILEGNTRIRSSNEKFSALLYIKTMNGYTLEEASKRAKFEQLTPVFPNERIHLEVKGQAKNISMRMMDLISPIGKGQRGMIVSQPKTGKTTLLKQVARSVTRNHPEMKLIVLLIDERPEEVTDIKESIQGPNVQVIYSTFDELPENHKRVSEMVIERAKRLVEHGEDVMILLDSITRLARAYNLTVQPSGRTLSGGLDPAALYMPKRFFGAARNMREKGSLTILATALVDTGSKMDDVVFEEFKGTGNMEMVLDRSLSEKRLFPAIDLPKSSTRRDDLLMTQEEIEANFLMRKAFSSSKSDEAVEKIIQMFRKTKDNEELIQLVKKVKIV